MINYECSFPGLKLSRLLIFDSAGIERISVPRPNLVLLWYLTGRHRLLQPSCVFTVTVLQHAQHSSSLKAKPARDTPSYRNVLIGGAAIRNPWQDYK